MRLETLPKQTEKEFQETFLQYLRLKGYLCYHTHDSRRSEPGFPDVVAVKPSRPVAFIELKAEGGQLSPAQRKWLNRLEESGAETHVLYPSDWDFIKRTFK